MRQSFHNVACKIFKTQQFEHLPSNHNSSIAFGTALSESEVLGLSGRYVVDSHLKTVVKIYHICSLKFVGEVSVDHHDNISLLF